jgi:hypothetical protein
VPGPGPADPAGTAEPAGEHGGREDSGNPRARKLEQIKDFYLTAEAIGEENVDKHFDHLLAQQRELISEYFKRPAAAKPDAADPHADAAQGAARGQAGPGQPGTGGEHPGGSSPAEGAGVAADQPRAW